MTVRAAYWWLQRYLHGF